MARRRTVYGPFVSPKTALPHRATKFTDTRNEDQIMEGIGDRALQNCPPGHILWCSRRRPQGAREMTSLGLRGGAAGRAAGRTRPGAGPPPLPASERGEDSGLRL